MSGINGKAAMYLQAQELINDGVQAHALEQNSIMAQAGMVNTEIKNGQTKTNANLSLGSGITFN